MHLKRIIEIRYIYQLSHHQNTRVKRVLREILPVSSDATQFSGFPANPQLLKVCDFSCVQLIIMGV